MKESAENIAIIIVNYKSQKLTIDYINNELSKLENDFNIIVVNNGATTKTNQELSQKLNAQIISKDNFIKSENKRYLIPSNENIGFARANNLAVEIIKNNIKPKYLVFSNNDIKISNPKTITDLINKLNSNNDIGIIGPKIKGLENELQSPEPYISFFNKYCWMYLLTPFISKQKKIEIFNLDYPQKAKEGFHYKIMGSFFVVKTEDFINCGMMDPNTFLYSEEVILSERMQYINKKVYYYPHVEITHAHGLTTTTTIGKKKINKYGLESDVYYYQKYKNVSPIKIKIGVIIYKLISRIKR